MVAMSIRVEFFGIPRQRTGVASACVEAASLGEMLDEVGRLFPRLAADCLDGPSLRPGYVASVNGRKFVTDPATPLAGGDAVLILSADVGG